MKIKKEYRIHNNIAFILKYIAQWQKYLIPISVLHIITSASTIFVMPFLVKIVIEQIETQKNMEAFIKTVIIYAVCMLVIYLCNNFCLNQKGWRLSYVRNKFIKLLISKVLGMEYQKLETPKVLDNYTYVERNLNDGSKGINGMIGSMNDMGIHIIQVAFAAAIIATLSPVIMLIALFFCIISLFPVLKSKNANYREVWDVLPPFWRKVSQLNYITSNFEYAKDIRMYDMSEWLSKKHVQINDDIHEKFLHSRFLWLRCNTVVNISSLLQEIALYAWLIYSLFYRGLSIANFTLYVSAFYTFSSAIGTLFWDYTSLRIQSEEVNDFRKFIDYSDENISSKSGKSIREFVKNNKLLEFTFDNVSFCYEGQKVYALKNLSLTLKPGRRLALVGLNGAGKSTMVKLLCRLYEPTEGRITLNGIDIREFEKSEYFELFSPVFQNVEVYPFTIAENVSMQESSKTDVNKAWHSVRSSGLGDKLDTLQKGINTQMLKVLYEDGVVFSGGESQKLALARALYKAAPVVILDEPTSALDAIAEYNLYQSFDKLIGDKTAIYISHRLSSTRFCYQIAMFSNGELIELGTHEELMAKKGPYSELFRVQAQYYTDDKEEVEVCG